jgi:hypothetical protein
VSPVKVTDGRGVGEEQKSYVCEKAWSSINYSILSDVDSPTAYTPPGKNRIAIRLFVVFINKFLIFKKRS